MCWTRTAHCSLGRHVRVHIWNCPTQQICARVDFGFSQTSRCCRSVIDYNVRLVGRATTTEAGCIRLGTPLRRRELTRQHEGRSRRPTLPVLTNFPTGTVWTINSLVSNPWYNCTSGTVRSFIFISFSSMHFKRRVAQSLLGRRQLFMSCELDHRSAVWYWKFWGCSKFLSMLLMNTV